jgi:CheY-like chemotaxis protein
MARVLLVDDDAAALRLRHFVLERAGHQVTSATSPDRAKSLLSAPGQTSVPEAVVTQTGLAQIIVLDLRLPTLADGLALLRHLRAAQPQLRIIVLSGWTEEFLNTPDAQLADVILSKPTRTERLLEAIAVPGDSPPDA